MNTTKPPTKILFCGFGRAGKDEAATFIAKITTLRYAGSFSWAGLPHMARVLGLHPCQAWEQRHKDRQFWKDELDKLRLQDQCHLARIVVASGDVAAGLRDKIEIDAVKAEGLFHRIVWIERPGTPVDPTVTFTPADCDEVLDNTGTLQEFHVRLFEWAVDNKLPMRRTEESEACLRASKFWVWSSEIQTGPRAFVSVPVRPFSVGNE